MITRNRYNLQGDTNYQGLSTDEKPKYGVPQNSLFLELDTKNIYYSLSASIDKPYKLILPEKTFAGTDPHSDGYYYYGFTNHTGVYDDTITVIYDGVEYVLNKKTTVFNSYGAPHNEVTGVYDFSEIPFYISSIHIKNTLVDIWSNNIFNGDGGEHTIEIYTKGTPAVWKKVGEPVPRTIFEATISEWENMDGSYWSDIIPLESEPEHPEHVIIIYDGEEYECTLDNSVEFYYSYGATYDDPMDFSEYPFNFMFDTDDGGSGEWFYQATVPTNFEHTFVIKEV